jgi:hypothetical protein
MARDKKPNVEIKRERVPLGVTYRVYINGMLMGGALSRNAAEKNVSHMLDIYARLSSRKLSKDA